MNWSTGELANSVISARDNILVCRRSMCTNLKSHAEVSGVHTVHPLFHTTIHVHRFEHVHTERSDSS